MINSPENPYLKKLRDLAERGKIGGADDRPSFEPKDTATVQLTEQEAESILKSRPEDEIKETEIAAANPGDQLEEGQIDYAKEETEQLEALRQEEINGIIIDWKDERDTLNAETRDSYLMQLKKLGDYATISEIINTYILKDPDNAALHELMTEFSKLYQNQ